MSRTVVSFVGNAPTQMMLDDTSLDLVQENPSKVDLAQLPEGSLVERGQGILALLCGDAQIQQSLTTLLLNPRGSAPAPLYFRIRAGAAAADAVGWEQLHTDREGFLTLDQRWPIGRIARIRKPVRAKPFQPPFRILAVLSAAGRDATPQLDALIKARDGAQVPVDLHVITGDEAMLATLPARGVTGELIATSGPALKRQLTAAKPHLVHLLSHGGGNAFGENRLVFATAVDVVAAQLDPSVVGSVFISLGQLADALLACDPWLVVLAACESAAEAGARQGQVLAHEVASAGVPAVIGMRRLVDITAVDTFAREFYPSALGLVNSAVGGAGGDRVIDWACALTDARVALGGPDPDTVDSWTDPVLYAQDDDLEIVVPTPAAAPVVDIGTLRGKIAKFRGGLAAMVASGADQPLLDELRATLAQMESQLTAASG